MNILLISYYFPPCGAIGAKRWGAFYDRSLADNEINFTVLTANWKGEKKEDLNIKFIGDEIEYVPPKSINQEYTLMDTIKHPTIAIRSIDRSIFGKWKKDAKIWIRENNTLNFDLVIASFGPTSSIALGNYAKKVYRIPYILDLRDLISIQGQKQKFPIIDSIDKQIDRYLTKDVDMFLVVSPTCNLKARKFYHKEIVTIYNGLEKKLEEEYIDLTLNNKQNLSILYMGTLGVNRNPKKVLLAINEYLEMYKNTQIEVKFASQDNPFDFIDVRDIPHLKVEWLGYISKQEMEKQKMASDIFLLLEDLSVQGNENLTGKIFEYISSKKPIIVSCNKESDIINLLKDTNVGNLINDSEDFKNFLLGKRVVDINKVNFYTREHQFERLAEALQTYNI